MCRNLLKSIEPRPVTGSQPVVAVNPSVQQGTPDVRHLLSPKVMSLTNAGYRVYSAGFNQPTVELPAARRAELTRETIPATTGDDADVPDTASIKQ